MFASFFYFLSGRSSCLSACFLAHRRASLPWCMYICLPAFLPAPQVLWDCHKVLITHMTSPTSCLPCILGLSGLKNPFTRLPLSFLLSLLSSVFSSFLLFPWVEPVVLYHAAPTQTVNRKCWLLVYAGITEHWVAWKVFKILLSYKPPHPTLLFCKQSSLSPTIRSCLLLCSMRQNPILLWFKWINILPACLFGAWLSGHIDRLKLVIYSSWFICKAEMHLRLIFHCFRVAYDEYHSAILIMVPPQCSLNTLKRANEKWKHRLCVSLHPFVRLMKELKLDSVLYEQILFTTRANSVS